jgi:hypothetical protein
MMTVGACAAIGATGGSLTEGIKGAGRAGSWPAGAPGQACKRGNNLFIGECESPCGITR